MTQVVFLFGHVNLITAQLLFTNKSCTATVSCGNLLVFFYAKKWRENYSKKSISENGLCLSHRCNHTVHGYVFYSLYVLNGSVLMETTGQSSVLAAIRANGGVYMFGTSLPIWAVILIEFCFAYMLEVLVGSPLSFRLASRVFDPKENHPMIFETAIICATVGIMCPAMSFLAAWFYYPYYAGFHILTLLANWLKLVCYNLPFAYFSQLFFIQPIVRVLFKALFAKQIKARVDKAHDDEAKGLEEDRPLDETEAIADVWKRMDELSEMLAHERRQRKRLQEKVENNSHS
jgi:hypothetical protein